MLLLLAVKKTRSQIRDKLLTADILVHIYHIIRCPDLSELPLLSFYPGTNIGNFRT